MKSSTFTPGKPTDHLLSRKTEALVRLTNLVAPHHLMIPRGVIKSESIYHKLYQEFVWLQKNTEVFLPSVRLFVEESFRDAGLESLLDAEA